MHNFFILQKYKLMELINKFRGKKEKQKSFLFGAIIFAVLIVVNFAVYINIARLMFNGLGQLGLDKVCLFHGIITSFSVLLIIGIMRVNTKAKTNDADLLLSLPIKKREIILLKSLNYYIFDLAFSLLLFSPFLIIYTIRHFQILTLILGLLLMFMLPLFSVGLSHIFSFVISKLFNRYKAGNFFKSLISVFIYIIILVLLFIKTTSYGFVDPNQMEAFFSDRPFMNILLNFVLNPNVSNILTTVSTLVLPFVLGIVLFSISYGKVENKYKNKNLELKFKNNQFGYILYKKELNYYVSTPSYIINTIIGPILIVILSIMFCIYKEKLSSFLGLDVNSLFYVMLLMIFVFLTSTLISCSSMSLEGKNLWILKTLPINENKLFTAKALSHFTISEPAVVLSAIILISFANISVLNFFILLLGGTIFNLILCFGGVLINLLYPKYDFDDETQIIKQSLSALLTMCLGLFLTFIPLIIYFAVKTLSLLYITLISIGIYAFVLALCLTILYVFGKKIFRKNS